MDCAKKRVKVEEDKEVQIDRKNERTESMDVDEEMQKEKKSFEAYCKSTLDGVIDKILRGIWLENSGKLGKWFGIMKEC